MVKNMETNKVYNLYDVLKIKKRKPLWQIRMEHEIKVSNNKSRKVLDRYTAKYGYADYDLDKCNADNMPDFVSTRKGEYNEVIMQQLEDKGVIHCIWDRGSYNCVGEWHQTFVCRHKDYKKVCSLLGLKMYIWEYEIDRGILRENWDKWSIVCGVHDGLWDNIGDLVEDKQYRHNEYKYDAVRTITINYIVENMDRFVNYFFKYDEYEALERIYFDSKREIGIK